jgi:hypothetical protein
VTTYYAAVKWPVVASNAEKLDALSYQLPLACVILRDDGIPPDEIVGALERAIDEVEDVTDDV